MNAQEQDQVKSLDFSNHMLTDVPPDVFQFERTLEELYLNSNRVNNFNFKDFISPEF